jgi:hypothetical protein
MIRDQTLNSGCWMGTAAAMLVVGLIHGQETLKEKPGILSWSSVPSVQAVPVAAVWGNQQTQTTPWTKQLRTPMLH